MKDSVKDPCAGKSGDTSRGKLNSKGKSAAAKINTYMRNTTTKKK